MADSWPPKLLAPTDRFIDEKQPDWHLNACVGQQLPPGQEGFDFYAKGFRLVARLAAMRLIDGNGVEFPLDTCVYPMVFNYRQHLELKLKVMSVNAQLLRGTKPAKRPKGHHLDKIWGEVRPMLEQGVETEKSPDEQGLDWSQNDIVTTLFAEFASFDEGEAARYPEDLDGRRYLQQFKLLNVRHFADTAERLSEYLDIVDEFLRELIRRKYATTPSPSSPPPPPPG
ncbi:MAG: hypothetical protein IT435_09600 [Phycisphaerales bacterium]|nr:hypothetical protein [Phycisphaerales bacterium]